jgi:hypothetical protein
LRHGAALESRTAGEIGPGERLILPDKLENNIPVNTARGLAGCSLYLGKIDMPQAGFLLQFTFYIGRIW